MFKIADLHADRGKGLVDKVVVDVMKITVLITDLLICMPVCICTCACVCVCVCCVCMFV